MNIELVKEDIKKYKGKKLKFKIYLGRNKYEYHEGYINKTHDNLFTIVTNSGTKSFSYSDLLIKNIVIVDKIKDCIKQNNQIS